MFRFFLCLFFFFAASNAEAIPTIYIYSGPGASNECLEQTLSALNDATGTKYLIKLIEPKELIFSNWEKEARLLIMPGGADLPYCRELNGPGNLKIANYVQNGGSYLGICAGAYYAGGQVEFALETELEVKGSRELSFFPGIVRGPLLAPYDYRTNSGARAATILWEGKKYRIFFNGGGYFVNAEQYQNVLILATYQIKALHYPAIVECSYGLGKAILSGVHIEYNPDLLDSKDCDYSKIIPILSANNESRKKLFKHILERLLEK